MRLIDAEALTQSISKKLVGLRAYEGRRMVEIVADCIVNAPTIEAKPVVHAHWEGGICSHCKLPWNYNMTDNGDDWGYFDPMPDYCCNCGAQMDGTDINVGSKTDHIAYDHIKGIIIREMTDEEVAGIKELIAKGKATSHPDPVGEKGEPGVKIPVISMEDVPKIMEELPSVEENPILKAVREMGK